MSKSGKTWEQERDKFWEELNVFADEYEPISKQAYVTYVVKVPIQKIGKAAFQPIVLYVIVRDDGLIEIDGKSYWFGKHSIDMTYDEKQEIYEYLTEWEYCEWKAIGPEDSELFATDKLLEVAK
jgi:hypothetical protein